MNQEAKETTSITQGQAVNAHGALQKLYGQNIPSDTAFDVYMMIQELKPIVNFQQDQRQKIIMEMKPRVENEGRTLNFGSPERLQEYQEKIRKLEELPLEIQIEPVDIQLTHDLVIAPADIENLKGFANCHK